MGFLSRFSGGVAPQKQATDDVLLLHTMLLMASAEGYISEAEIETVEAFFATLPEFKDKQFRQVFEEANKLVARYGNLKESVKALSEIKSPAVRRKAYVLAADIALSSGEVDEAEDQMLDTMMRLLDIDDAFAQKVLEVLTVKYAK